jgi:hypothetical protein
LTHCSSCCFCPVVMGKESAGFHIPQAYTKTGYSKDLTVTLH